MSNSLDPDADQDRHAVDLDLVPNYLQSYQQKTQLIASKERVI